MGLDRGTIESLCTEGLGFKVLENQREHESKLGISQGVVDSEHNNFSWRCHSANLVWVTCQESGIGLCLGVYGFSF